jgi:hypothetical protein
MSTAGSAGTGNASDAWPCPHCGAPLVAVADGDGMVTWGCGRRAYAGYLAEGTYLTARLHWLDERIAAGDGAPDAETARRFGVWPVSSGLIPSRSGHPPARRESHGAQTLLLGLGAGLLVVAGVVFTAVVWHRLGAAGQVGIMAVATLGFGALAARLVRRLPGTAEALAVVAFGLAAIDAVAAPALGLVPDAWIYRSHPYPVLVTLVAATAAVGLGHLLRLRAWVWLGWFTAGVGAGLAATYLAFGVAGSSEPGAALSVSVVAVAAVGLLAGPHLSMRLQVDLPAMAVAGSATLLWAVLAWLTWVSDLSRPALLGTLATTLVTAAAALLVWLRTHLDLAGLGAAALVGVAGGLAFLLPGGQHTYWLPAVVAAAGVVALGALAQAGYLRVGLLVSALLWTTWAVGRLAIGRPGAEADPVLGQLSVLLVLVAVTWFVVAGWGLEPMLAWPAAVAGEAALLAARPDLPDLPESWTLPFAALLLGSGYLWRRSDTVGSLAWLGPAVVIGLLPSAFACWAAPWVNDVEGQSTGTALVRLVTVLGLGLAGLAFGARLRTAGLVVPSAVALVLAGAAQIWGGLAAMPRWVALALAGAALIIVGARLERLRGRGRELGDFVDSLR